MAFENLTTLTSAVRHLWIGCPASNYPYGSPEYYSAGYSPDFLQKNLSVVGMDILYVDYLGTKRNYFLTHVTRIWADEKLHISPLLSGFSRFYPSQIWSRLISHLYSGKLSNDINVSTESFIFAQKPTL